MEKNIPSKLADLLIWIFKSQNAHFFFFHIIIMLAFISEIIEREMENSMQTRKEPPKAAASHPTAVEQGSEVLFFAAPTSRRSSFK